MTGDHGESLGEHGESTHGVFLYDAMLRVPLVLVDPDANRPRRVSAPVSLADVAPTLAVTRTPCRVSPRSAMVVAGLGNGAFMSVPNSMISGVADVEELETGKRDEGLYFGTYTLAYKAGTAISWVLSGTALTWIGFSPGASAQTEEVRFRLAMVPTYLLLATAPIAVFFVSKYGITRERWKETRALLETRQASAR